METGMRPDVKKLLSLVEGAKAPPLETLTPDAARRALKQSVSILERPAPAMYRRENIHLDGPAGPVPARIYQPANISGPAPVLMFFHGGGWVIGDLDTHDSLAAEMAHLTGWTTVSVGYRRAPEAHWPAAVEDCTAATRLVANAEFLVGHPISGIVLSGDSAGGNLAAILARSLRREMDVLAQWLIYPGVDFTASGGSLDAFADGFLITTSTIRWFHGLYAPIPTDECASPLLSDDWDGLPPTLLFTAGLDPVRDQGRAYAARLAATGNTLIFREGHGLIHGAMNFRGGIASAQKDLELMAADMKRLVP